MAFSGHFRQSPRCPVRISDHRPLGADIRAAGRARSILGAALLARGALFARKDTLVDRAGLSNEGLPLALTLWDKRYYFAHGASDRGHSTESTVRTSCQFVAAATGTWPDRSATVLTAWPRTPIVQVLRHQIVGQRQRRDVFSSRRLPDAEQVPPASRRSQKAVRAENQTHLPKLLTASRVSFSVARACADQPHQAGSTRR